MSNKILVSILVAVVVVGGTTTAVLARKNSPSKTVAPVVKTEPENQTLNTKTTMDTDGGTETAESMAKEKTDFEKSDTMMKDEKKAPSTGEAMMSKHGDYKDYSTDTVTAEQKAGHKVVLFFHAPWCPYCRAADAAFKANADAIPAGVTVLKTDYDSNTALKSKYGVTYQHTFVQIDNNGNLVTKWVSGDTDLLKQNIK